MKIVVAIGGNALITPGSAGYIADQFAHSRQMARPLADLVQRGWQLTIVHGNGPQVGSVMRRVEIAANQVYPIDLGLAVADTQAGMGYMIAQTLRNELHHRGIQRDCVAVVTSVLVDERDPGFARPTKPIGPFLTPAEAEEHRRRDGWTVVEEPGRGLRRVVASPEPLGIVEMAAIQTIVDNCCVLVAGGGGGIPVIRNARGELHGVEAVVDKDLTACLLAMQIQADALAIITGVREVYINYRKPGEEPLRQVSISKLEALIREGHFPAGSMLPKVTAALDFLRARDDPRARSIITDWETLPAALEAKAGTTVTL
jgi:carbamate kinase